MSTRFTNFTEENKKAVAQSLRDGASVKEAADAVGISKRTVYYWLHGDPEFAALIESYKKEMINTVKGESYRMAQTEEYVETKQSIDEHGKKKVEKTTKIRWASIPAIDLFLRNRDKGYVQRIQPSDGSGTAAELAAELRQHMAELDKPDMAPPTEDGT